MLYIVLEFSVVVFVSSFFCLRRVLTAVLLPAVEGIGFLIECRLTNLYVTAKLTVLYAQNFAVLECYSSILHECQFFFLGFLD